MKRKAYLLLHLLMLIYAAGSVFGKLAAGEAFPSPRFLLFCGLEFLMLALYALSWLLSIRFYAGREL